MTAVCHRCGGDKAAALDDCPACGHRPIGADRELAWLFSDRHLNAAELAEASRRITAGDRPEPSPTQRRLARRALARVDQDPMPPLSRGQVAALVAGCALLTPLVGWAVWFGLLTDRPRAARQALAVALPTTALFGLAWVGMLAFRVL